MDILPILVFGPDSRKVPLLLLALGTGIPIPLRIRRNSWTIVALEVIVVDSRGNILSYPTPYIKDQT